ncbi:MAG: bifunctional glutamate N-acetyltransferase/amino-acid acetyltransferase ArgJ [Candidatus Aquicultorales bacterium]
MAYKHIPGGVTAPKGFKASGIACGIKQSGKTDLAIVFSDAQATGAGVFTKNVMVAPPVLLSKANLESGTARAMVVNSGNANACTGAQGYADSVLMAEIAARALGLCVDDVVVASTGIIGVPLPIEKVQAGIIEAAGCLSETGSSDAASAIMTTDLFPKESAVEVVLSGGSVRIGGIAKGSGMIAPNMATMLAFITTDAAIGAKELKDLLVDVTDRTFNSITVDGDTSTNDMLVVLANGMSGVDVGADDLEAFGEALESLCSTLGKMIVKDGEGATKIARITVGGGASKEEAKAAAMAIANSKLVKTALFGSDPNWGRIACAAGYSGAGLDPNMLKIDIAGITTVEKGVPVPFDDMAASDALAAEEVEITVDLGVGEASATVWTCDLSYDYVRINSEYRT